MIALTARGDLAKSYLENFPAEVISIREISQDLFHERLSQCEVIINNAASIKLDDPEQYRINNFECTRDLVDYLVDNNKNAHLVQISSMSILSVDDSTKYADESNMSPYALSKYLAEKYVLQSALPHISVVRFSTIFYRNPEKDGISRLIYDAVKTGEVTIYNDGTARRNVIPIEIAVAYLHKLTSSSKRGVAVYNLAAVTSVSFADIIGVIKQHLPNLKVKNIHTEQGVDVLHVFDLGSTKELGMIDFSLDEYITSYIKDLQDETSDH